MTTAAAPQGAQLPPTSIGITFDELDQSIRRPFSTMLPPEWILPSPPPPDAPHLGSQGGPPQGQPQVISIENTPAVEDSSPPATQLDNRYRLELPMDDLDFLTSLKRSSDAQDSVERPETPPTAEDSSTQPEPSATISPPSTRPKGSPQINLEEDFRRLKEQVDGFRSLIGRTDGTRFGDRLVPLFNGHMTAIASFKDQRKDPPRFFRFMRRSRAPPCKLPQVDRSLPDIRVELSVNEISHFTQLMGRCVSSASNGFQNLTDEENLYDCYFQLQQRRRAANQPRIRFKLYGGEARMISMRFLLNCLSGEYKKSLIHEVYREGYMIGGSISLSKELRGNPLADGDDGGEIANKASPKFQISALRNSPTFKISRTWTPGRRDGHYLVFGRVVDEDNSLVERLISQCGSFSGSPTTEVVISACGIFDGNDSS